MLNKYRLKMFFFYGYIKKVFAFIYLFMNLVIKCIMFVYKEINLNVWYVYLVNICLLSNLLRDREIIVNIIYLVFLSSLLFKFFGIIEGGKMVGSIFWIVFWRMNRSILGE